MTQSAAPRAASASLSHTIRAFCSRHLRLTKSQDKDKDAHRKSSPPPAKRPRHFSGVFTVEGDPRVKPDKDEDRRIHGVLERLRSYGINTMVESNARYALRITAAHGDGEAAFRLLMLLQETYEGIVRPYSPHTRLLGAVNRESVTCYLDALLFGMFARLDSFEAMLYDNFDDMPRKRLAGLLRLWVNMLRTGRLITTDVTRRLQEALSDCGWQDAGRLRQQDPSEAFTFITGQLELPLLTLKMDLHHAGKEDPQDDHKFVNERLLEVAILDEPPEGRDVITLEDCLEHYFNNTIEVKRHMENQRRNTLKTGASADSDSIYSPVKVEKDSGIHVEVAEIGSASNTPITQTPMVESPTTAMHPKDPVARVRPTWGRKRGDSIFSQRKVELVGVDPEMTKEDPETAPPERERKLSTRTEVLMPAWQFFKLLPWYTDHMPTSDAQVAAHFSKKRPVLGVCLKRYAFTNSGQATRRDTFVDIPTEIAVPNFVSDEHMQDEGPLVGNFRLLLQSVVCHRGASVHSGHYVCLSRGTASNATDSRRGSSDSDDIEDPWMLFDDLAKERVKYVDIREALKRETPYLLFYQVQPIGDDGHSIHDLPTYAEATSRSQSITIPLEKPYLNEPPGSESGLEHKTLHSLSRMESHSTDLAATASGRSSLDVGNTLDGPRGRSSFQRDEQRKSITFDRSSFAGSASGGSTRTDPTVSVPSTPLEEETLDEKNSTGLLAVANKFSSSRRGSRVSKDSTSKSRPGSAGPDSNANRFSLNMSKLTQRISRSDNSDAPTVVVEPRDDITASSAGSTMEKHDSLGAAEDPPRASTDTSTRAQGLKVHGKASMTGLTRKEKAAVVKAGKRRGKRGEDDRDCVVM